MKTRISNLTYVPSRCFLFYLLLFLPFCMNNLIGQNKGTDLVEGFLEANPKLHKYNIEKFFLHTNKTRYVAGEKIWFKAYVVNDVDNRPSIETTNLHINLYNQNKELISHELFLVSNGRTHGELELDEQLAAGTYFIELATQWNENFSANTSLTAIEILGESSTQDSRFESATALASTTSDQAITSTIQMNFFPESNVLLENIENNVSFTSTMNGAPLAITADLIDDETGIIVAKLSSNAFGMGKFQLYTRPLRSYTAYLNYDGIQYKFPLEKAQLNGMVIQKNEKQDKDGFLNIEVKTNEATIKNEAGNFVFAVVHRKGKENAIIPVKLKKQYINYSFYIAEHDLFNGVNSITLFNEQNKPIADYAFFHTKEHQERLEVQTVRQDKDSISLRFNYRNAAAPANLSISFLPEGTKVYTANSSINAAFLLAPYLESNYLNLDQVLNASNSSEHIQLLLNTGKKKNSLPYTKKPDHYKNGLFTDEHGIFIKGNVSANISDLTGYKVMLSSEKNELLLVEEIGASNSFMFDNLYMMNTENDYKLALLDPQGKIVKTGFRISEESTAYRVPKQLESAPDWMHSDEEHLEYASIEQPELLENMETLDEVKVSIQKKQSEKLKALGIPNQIGVNDFANVFEIDEDEYAVDIYQYLQRLPFINVEGTQTHFYLTSRRGKNSITGAGVMGIMIDDLRYTDTEVLVGRRANEFSAIVINMTGAGHGIYGGGGIVSFYTRNTFNNTVSNKNDFVFSETSIGFSSAAKTYEGDALFFANEQEKIDFGTVQWVPNFDILPSKQNILTISPNGYQHFKAIIYGIGNDGAIISEMIPISIDSD